MVFIKHNSQKWDIFFNPIFIPCFSGSRFFRFQVFQGPGFSGSGSRVWVQVLEVAVRYAQNQTKTEQRQWRRYGVSNVNIEHISHFILLFQFFTLNK